MKNDEMYPLYIAYLDCKLNSNQLGDKLSKSKVSLLKISKKYFLEFKDRFEEDELFNKKILELYKSDIRNQKIEDIFNDIDCGGNNK